MEAWKLVMDALPTVLPCSSCRRHAFHFISKHPPDIRQPWTWLFSLWLKVRQRLVKHHKREARRRAILVPNPQDKDAIMRSFSTWKYDMIAILKQMSINDLALLCANVLFCMQWAALGNDNNNKNHLKIFEKRLMPIIDLSAVAAKADAQMSKLFQELIRMLMVGQVAN